MDRKDILPICIKAGALDDVPARPLDFAESGKGVLIEAKDLVNGVSMVQIERVEKVEYVHVALDCHDIIIAAGVVTKLHR
jgi:hypothetical protein